MRTVVISGASRTPMGGFHGDLAGASAVLLGGVFAPGYSIGAPGTRGPRRDVAAICIGGGEGTAIAVERP